MPAVTLSRPVPVDSAVLAAPVAGLGLRPGTFADQLDPAPGAVTLVVFLRHHGCLFFREVVADFAAARAAAEPYPEVIFVYQGDPADGPAWFGPLAPGTRAIADAPKRFFDAFGVERGGVREMFGLRSVGCGLRAVRKGHFIGRKVGDPWTLPLVVAMRDRHVVWEYRGRYAGDSPDPAVIPKLLEKLP